MTGRELHWASNEQEIVLRIEETGGKGNLHIAGKSYDFVVHDRQPDGGWLELQGKNQRFYLHRNREEITVWIGGRTYRLTRLQKGQAADQVGVAGGEVRALMPGKILRVDVAPGDVVTERQAVVTMESMKMESALAAPLAGTVVAVKCQVGQIVDMGEVLVIIE